ncbi:MAG TPA: Mrp/NBP35 family ATP-binding protein [Acidimicrobiales bacterium]|nr:Mrp/NBP35 family ATP-binding protein [Acidimicrobiales bacterium]
MPAPHVIAVASGKGGVGKSTVTVNLGATLAQSGVRVGLVDADVYGPNVPLMLGLTRRTRSESISLARASGAKRTPIERFGMKVMSAQFLIAEDQPVAFDAALVRLLVQGLMEDTKWGELDVMLVDLPPGTADLQQGLSRSFALTGALVVVTPQDVAHLDGRKAVAMFRQSAVPVLGGVENMAGLSCPHCEEHIDVFPRVVEERSIWANGVELLVRIPLEPAVSRSAELGTPIVLRDPGSPVAAAFEQLARTLEVEAK